MRGIEEGRFAESLILKPAPGKDQIIECHVAGQHETARLLHMPLHRDMGVLPRHPVQRLNDDLIHFTQRQILFRGAGKHKVPMLVPLKEIGETDHHQFLGKIILGTDQVRSIEIGILTQAIGLVDEIAQGHPGRPLIRPRSGNAIALDRNRILPDLDILGDGDRVAIHESDVLGWIAHHLVEIDIHQHLALVQFEAAQLHLFRVSIRLEATGQFHQLPHALLADKFVIVRPQHFALDGHRLPLERDHNMIPLPNPNQFQVQVAGQKKAVKIHRINLTVTTTNLHGAQRTGIPHPAGVVDQVDDIRRSRRDPIIARGLHLAQHEYRQFVQLSQPDIHERGALRWLDRIDEGGVDLPQRPHDLRTQFTQHHPVGRDPPATLRQIDVSLLRNHQIQGFRQFTPDRHHDLIAWSYLVAIVDRPIGYE